MKVIVVVGEPNQKDIDMNLKERFKKEADNFIKRLTKDFGFHEDDFAVLAGGLRLLIESRLETLFLEKMKEDILLCYIGHGGKNCWGLSGYADKEAITYENLRLLLALHHGNLIFLNHCCYALAAEEAVLSRFGDYLLIGAMPADSFGPAPYFLHRVLDYWLYQRLVNEWKIGNSSLNDLMYSRSVNFSKRKAADL